MVECLPRRFDIQDGAGSVVDKTLYVRLTPQARQA
jgi:hypothetical protein